MRQRKIAGKQGDDDDYAEIIRKALSQDQKQTSERSFASRLDETLIAAREVGLSQSEILAAAEAVRREKLAKEGRRLVFREARMRQSLAFLGDIIGGGVVSLLVHWLGGWAISKWALLVYVGMMAIRLVRWVFIPLSRKELVELDMPDRVHDVLSNIDLIPYCSSYSEYASKLLEELGFDELSGSVRSDLLDSCERRISSQLRNTLLENLDDYTLDAVIALLERGHGEKDIAAYLLTSIPDIDRKLAATLDSIYQQMKMEAKVLHQMAGNESAAAGQTSGVQRCEEESVKEKGFKLGRDQIRSTVELWTSDLGIREFISDDDLKQIADQIEAGTIEEAPYMPAVIHFAQQCLSDMGLADANESIQSQLLYQFFQLGSQIVLAELLETVGRLKEDDCAAINEMIEAKRPQNDIFRYILAADAGVETRISAVLNEHRQKLTSESRRLYDACKAQFGLG